MSTENRYVALERNLDAALAQAEKIREATEALKALLVDPDMEWTCRDIPEQLRKIALGRAMIVSRLTATKYAKISLR